MVVDQILGQWLLTLPQFRANPTENQEFWLACSAEVELFLWACSGSSQHQESNLKTLFCLQVTAKLGMQCLVEVHTIAELERVLQIGILEQNCMLGINNRDLQSFKVDLKNTDSIMGSPAGQEAIRRGLLFAGESGIFTPEHVSAVQVTTHP